MAITKIFPIKTNLSRAVAYIEDPKKTEAQLLVSGYNVDPLMAAVEFELTAARARSLVGDRERSGGGNNLAYHLIQSFSPTDNVTPESAHEIGKQLADQFLGGEFEYVISTHVDKGHIHNHIIINSVSFLTHKKLRTVPYKTAAKLRTLNDKVCIENNLSIIRNPKGIGKTKGELAARAEGRSWKQQIQERLNYALQSVCSYEEFLTAAKDLGVTVDDTGKHIKYLLDGQKRYTRGDRLNPELRTKADIVSVCENRREAAEQIRKVIEKSDNLVDLRKAGISIRHTAAGRLFSLGELELPEPVLRREKVDILASYEAVQMDRSHRNQMVPIVLRTKELEKITENGVCLRLGERLAFISKSDVDIGEEESTIWIRSKREYLYGSEKIRGEELLRGLETQKGIMPETVPVSTEAVRISDSAVRLSFPDLGIQGLILDRANAELTTTGAKVQLYHNWSYRYQTALGKTSYIKGGELIEALKSQPVINDGSLQWKLQRAQQKATISDSKAIAAALTVLRAEGIADAGEINNSFALLRKRQTDAAGEIQVAKQKLSQYREIAKLLRAVQTYKGIEKEYAGLSGKARERFRALHEGELTMYAFAVRKLEAANINAAADLGKVEELMVHMEGELQRLEAAKISIGKRIEELAAAQQTVNTIVQRTQDR